MKDESQGKIENKILACVCEIQKSDDLVMDILERLVLSLVEEEERFYITPDEYDILSIRQNNRRVLEQLRKERDTLED